MKKQKKVVDEKAHAEFGASASKRWLECPGSIALSRGMPNFESEYALEGTEAHSCLEFLLRNRIKQTAAIAMAEKKYNKEQIGHALDACDYVEELLDTPNTEMFIETKIDSSAFTTKNQFSTLDIAVAHYNARNLHIIDYKYGAGLAVEVEHNPQLIYYALAMLLKLGWKKFDKATLTIIQPRKEDEKGNTIRSWVIDNGDLLAWGRKFKTGVKIAESSNAPLKSGEHCRFCLARIKCPKLKDEAMKQAQIDFSPSTSVVKKLPDLKKVDDIGKLLDACDKLQVFINAVKERAYNDAKRGVKVNGYKLVEKRTTRKWTNESKAAEAAFKALGKKAFTEPLLLSPAQFEKKFKKFKSAQEFLKKNVTNKTGGTTLARIDNKKKAIDIFEAEFTKLGN